MVSSSLINLERVDREFFFNCCCYYLCYKRLYKMKVTETTQLHSILA